MTQPDAHTELPLKITAYSAVTCLGRDRAAHVEALKSGRSGLAVCEYPDVPFDCYVGQVTGIENDPFPSQHSAFDNRANRLAMAGLTSDDFAEAVATKIARYGAQRVGLVIGTSTSGVERLEAAYRSRQEDDPLPAEYSLRHHNDYQAVAAFLQDYLRIEGPSYTVSTACSSSAKAIVDAGQLIQAGICDAVLAGGVDSLCLISLCGFEALQLVSRKPCRPCDVNRDGLSIGEGAAFVLLERDASEGVRLSGAGESSDGFNMSTPPEDGAGAQRAMRTALKHARLRPEDIGYVNLHGTATPINDAVECAVVADTLGTEVPVSSLKGAVGHTLGAAGAVEAVLCLIALEEGIVPGNTGLETLDPRIACAVSSAPQKRKYHHSLSNAFGFGGNNCSLVLSLT